MFVISELTTEQQLEFFQARVRSLEITLAKKNERIAVLERALEMACSDGTLNSKIADDDPRAWKKNIYDVTVRYEGGPKHMEEVLIAAAEKELEGKDG